MFPIAGLGAAIPAYLRTGLNLPISKITVVKLSINVFSERIVFVGH